MSARVLVKAKGPLARTYPVAETPACVNEKTPSRESSSRGERICIIP